MRTMYKSGPQAVKASDGRPFRIRRGIFSRKGAKVQTVRNCSDRSFLNLASLRLCGRYSEKFKIENRKSKIA
jgi:hypothetical protein